MLLEKEGFMANAHKILTNIPKMIGLFFLGLVVWILDVIILTLLSAGYRYVIDQEMPSGREIAQGSTKLYLYVFIFILSVIFRIDVQLRSRLWVIVKGSLIIFSILLFVGVVASFIPFSVAGLFAMIAVGFILQIVMFMYSGFILPKKLLKKYEIKKAEDTLANYDSHQTSVSKENGITKIFEKTNDLLNSLKTTQTTSFNIRSTQIKVGEVLRKNRKILLSLFLILGVFVVGFATKRMLSKRIQCDTVFEIGNESHDMGRLNLLTYSCNDYYVDAGWYIDDVKILYASKRDPDKGYMVKQVKLYTRDHSGLVKLPEPYCFRQVWNEETKEGGTVQLECDGDPDFSRLLEILDSVSQKQSVDKRHLILDYSYTE